MRCIVDDAVVQGILYTQVKKAIYKGMVQDTAKCMQLAMSEDKKSTTGMICKETV